MQKTNSRFIQIIIVALFLIELIANEEISDQNLKDGYFLWSLSQTLTSTNSSETFGYSIDLSSTNGIIGDPNEQTFFVYELQGSIWVYTQNASKDHPSFGSSVGIGYDSITAIIGSPSAAVVDAYLYGGSIFSLDEEIPCFSNPSNYGACVTVSNYTQEFGSVFVVADIINNQLTVYNTGYYEIGGKTGEHLGYSIAISSDASTLIASTNDTKNVYVYLIEDQTGYLTLFQTMNGELYPGFGNDLAISEDGHVIAIAAMLSGSVFIFRFSGENWVEEQILFVADSNFGSSVALSQDANQLLVGANLTNTVYAYNYSGGIWNEIQSISGSDGFGTCVSISDGFFFASVSVNGSGGVQIYQLQNSGHKIDLINCTSLVSAFECYWQQPENDSSLEYEIDYGFGWMNISDPSFDVSTNMFSKLFNSSNLPNITGNEEYLIAMRACVPFGICGSSEQTQVTTGIDAVSNYTLITNPQALQMFFQPPDVEVIEGIAHLYQYVFILTQTGGSPQTNYLSNASNYIEIRDLEENTQYSAELFACKTSECQGDNKGESLYFSFLTLFSPPVGVQCSVSNVVDVTCSWAQPPFCEAPSYYMVTYQSLSSDDHQTYATYSDGIQFSVHFPNQTYLVNVSTCDSNYLCGSNTSTQISSTELSQPTILDSISKIEEIEIVFTKVNKAKSYLVSLDGKASWRIFTSMHSNGSEMIGTIYPLYGNVVYNVSIRGCSEISCEAPYLGLESEIISIKPKLGNITSFHCNPTVCGFECEWDPLELSDGLKAYSFEYNSESICLDQFTTNYPVSNLLGGKEYQISIFASDTLNCESNEYSGISSSTSLTTNYIPAPTIIQSNSKIEEIEIVFTPLTAAKAYLISIDGRISWRSFTSIHSNGSGMIGTINHLAGNVEYYVSIRGCSDTNCTIEYAGLANSPLMIKPKLGNITSFNCNPTVCGFECEWELMELSTGLRGYGLTYNSETICIAKSMNQISIFNLIGGSNYQISIFASSDWRCETNEYSGLPSTVSIKTLQPTTQEASESSTDIKVVVPAVIVPILVVAIIIIIIIWIRHRSKKGKKDDNQQNKEMELK